MSVRHVDRETWKCAPNCDLCTCCESAKASCGYSEGQILIFLSEILLPHGSLAGIKNMGHSQYPSFSQFTVHIHSHQFYPSLFRSSITAAWNFVWKRYVFFLALHFWNAASRGKSRVLCIRLLIIDPTVSLITFLQYSATLRPFARLLLTHFFKLKWW